MILNEGQPKLIKHNMILSEGDKAHVPPSGRLSGVLTTDEGDQKYKHELFWRML